MDLRLFVKGSHAIRAKKVSNEFAKYLDLKGATFDDGWSVDRLGKPQYTIVKLPHNLVAVHTETLKGLRRGRQISDSKRHS